MELKSLDKEALVAAVKKAAEEGRQRVDRAVEAVLDDIAVAARGLMALEHGVGPILERAQHVFVAEFHWKGAWSDQAAVCDPQLRFSESGYVFDLSTASWLHCRERAPKMRNNTRYRAILVLEPMEQRDAGDR
jgi:hypothetical protein